MKFRDIFLPKIARSDPKTRIQAVKETADKQLLKKVIENDANSQVREVAKSRLKELST